MSSSAIRTIALPFGERIPALGLGTWYMGEDPGRRETELAFDRAFPPPAEKRPLEML